jgi:hypothetical protein
VKTLERVEDRCPTCGGIVVSLKVRLPWGVDDVQGTCGRCADVAALAERRAFEARALAMARAETGGDVDVWPGLEPHVRRVMEMTNPGLILVVGDMMSGRTTLARAWVERSIRQVGVAALYLPAADVIRMQASDLPEASARWETVPRLALDGVAQWGASIPTWQADRLAQILSARHRLLTLVTVPIEAAESPGGVVLAERLGVDLARRLLMTAKASGQRVRLTSREVSGG